MLFTRQLKTIKKEKVNMKNRQVGMIIVGIAIVIGVIIFLFNSAMIDIVNTTCSHGPSCSMYGNIRTQTYVGISLVAVIVIIGLVLIFSKENERVVVRQKTITKTEKKKPVSLSGLDKKEREVIRIIQSENGAIFQASLMEKIGIGKVGITRLLDKLEAKQLIERKRRGMNNIVILK